MKFKALSLALAQTLLPTFSKEQTQTKRGNPTTRSQTSTISKKERKKRRSIKRQSRNKTSEQKARNNLALQEVFTLRFLGV
ncbi:hypothetical protein [Helicobacter sp. UBA3407]|uniref:hypothetical protein n=1 Tax=Helicobacter sp. UBA3407 TaxID=1946588 RepID=UPI00262B16D7|nr:hypothetical protein [Helicobacter sp. UBA3407]